MVHCTSSSVDLFGLLGLGGKDLRLLASLSHINGRFSVSLRLQHGSPLLSFSFHLTHRHNDKGRDFKSEYLEFISGLGLARIIVLPLNVVKRNMDKAF